MAMQLEGPQLGHLVAPGPLRSAGARSAGRPPATVRPPGPRPPRWTERYRLLLAAVAVVAVAAAVSGAGLVRPGTPGTGPDPVAAPVVTAGASGTADVVGGPLPPDGAVEEGAWPSPGANEATAADGPGDQADGSGQVLPVPVDDGGTGGAAGSSGADTSGIEATFPTPGAGVVTPGPARDGAVPTEPSTTATTPTGLASGGLVGPPTTSAEAAVVGVPALTPPTTGAGGVPPAPAPAPAPSDPVGPASTSTTVTSGGSPSTTPTGRTDLPGPAVTAAAPTTVAPGAVATSTTGRAVPTTTLPASVPPPSSSSSSSTSTTAPAATAPGSVLWADTFDRLDPNRWRSEHSTYGDGNGELQCYRPGNVTVSGGRLVLRAVAETYTCPNGSVRQVTSGMVRSRGLTLAPGQALEFRVRLTPGDDTDQGGLWPAVWSSGWGGGGWPRSGELDFLEVMTARNPRRSVYSIHYARPDGSHGSTNREHVSAGNFSDQWHVVRFEYGHGGRLAWYLDGVQVHTVAVADTLQGYPAPFDAPISEIKINLALGGRPGPLADGALAGSGAIFEVDYIRAVAL